MPEGKCPNCGTSFHGWALTDPEKRTCPECGVVLDIMEEKKQGARSEPFATEGPIIDKTLDDYQPGDIEQQNGGD